TGNWVGFRDCHIKPDLVLIYRVFNDQLQLARIGSHSDLF
ncbi:TPA: type II toxin-antitoxin system YafQ family toxin, partial [Vibrio cholerae]